MIKVMLSFGKKKKKTYFFLPRFHRVSSGVNGFYLCLHQGFLVVQKAKKENPPSIQETWVQTLGWTDLLEKGRATHSSILAWKIPGTEEAARLQSMGL